MATVTRIGRKFGCQSRIMLSPEARAKRAYRQSGRATITATVSPETITRLTDEACHDHRFEGMSREEVAVWVADHVAKLIAPYPWWFGHTPEKPSRPKQPCTAQQRAALEKARVARTKLSSWREIEA